MIGLVKRHRKILAGLAWDELPDSCSRFAVDNRDLTHARNVHKYPIALRFQLEGLGMSIQLYVDNLSAGIWVNRCQPTLAIAYPKPAGDRVVSNVVGVI